MEMQAETDRTKFIKTLENCQRFIATKQTVNKEKATLK
jgi:hypothetical protein